MEDSRDVARKCLQELQERSMASRFEVMQDIEVLEQEMNRMSKELCDNIKSIINNEYDNDELFSTINLEYEHIEKIRRKIHRIQQMIFGFSSQTQNIFDGNSPNVEDCASTTNRSSENDTDKAAESVNNDCQITISSATTPALSPPHQTDLKVVETQDHNEESKHKKSRSDATADHFNNLLDRFSGTRKFLKS